MIPQSERWNCIVFKDSRWSIYYMSVQIFNKLINSMQEIKKSNQI